MTDNVMNCSICSCEFTEDESGVIGEFGMMPVAFCPTCFTSMLDMADQFNQETDPLWVEVTNEQGNTFILDPIKESDKVESAKSNGLSIVPLYAAPPKKEWVGLTDKEVVIFAYQSQENECTAIRLAEAKLKEKNT